MGSQTLYIEVRRGNSVFGLILVGLLLIMSLLTVYAMGLIKNTYPYWEKQMLKSELECKEFHKLLKQYLNYKHMGSSNFIVKLVNRNWAVNCFEIYPFSFMRAHSQCVLIQVP